MVVKGSLGPAEMFQAYNRSVGGMNILKQCEFMDGFGAETERPAKGEPGRARGSNEL